MEFCESIFFECEVREEEQRAERVQADGMISDAQCHSENQVLSGWSHLTVRYGIVHQALDEPSISGRRMTPCSACENFAFTGHEAYSTSPPELARSLFFFAHFTLKKDRLAKLHKQMCVSLETEDLHLVLEMPMGTFKTTVGTEALSMWWALPFTLRDEHLMRELGYGDEWIAG